MYLVYNRPRIPNGGCIVFQKFFTLSYILKLRHLRIIIPTNCYALRQYNRTIYQVFLGTKMGR